MRKQDLTDLIGYMYWANGRLLDAAAGLPVERFTEATSVTTRDLRATLVHELDVEWSWRLALQGRPIEELGEEQELKPLDYPDVAALREHWTRDEAEMRMWLDGLADDDLAADITPALSKDTRPLWHFFIHIVMHATQQQADAATLLTLAGQSPGEIGYLDWRDAFERSG